jgi:nucleotide-binding universal stress UspA family protein
MPETTGAVTSNSDQVSPIVVATDFSPDSEAALLWASRQASLTDAPLIVLHVVHDPADAAGFYRSEEANAPEMMSDVASRMMSKFLKKAREKYANHGAIQSAIPELVAGLPASRIVEVAQRDGAGLIVLGSRGLTGLSGILVGSVAERVAQIAPMPVVIVKDKKTELDR